jgi:aminomethyltransferase
MKTTVFSKLHEEMGAKMVEFAGFYMPIQFEGVNIEHETVRKGIGVFDVSHMGEFWVRGPKAFDFLQYVTSNDLALLSVGKAQYSCLPNGKGGIVDDLLIYHMAADNYLLVVNAANIDKDWNWLVPHAEKFGLKVGVDFTNESDDYSQLAVQGPLAMKAMQKLTQTSIMDMEYYSVKVIDFAGVKDVIFSTTGYTGSGGCEIYMKNADALKIFKAVFEAGAEFGVKPIGLGARDTLRLEMGFCLYGNDIDDTTSPIEAGLGWITKFNDSKDFIDKEYNFNLKTNGVKRKLIGFEMIDKGIPRHDYEICNAEGLTIGRVTSGTMGPSIKIGVGLGYVATEMSKVGTEIFIKVREKLLKAVIVKTPFYKG